MENARKTHYTNDREDLLLRLRRMEGQVRGLQHMVEEDRYCLDVVTQINALTSASREVELIVLEAHLRACVEEAVSASDGEEAVREMTNVLRRTLRP